jgi:uncharacterized protein YndB with AHSA1/START domain
MQAQDTMLKKLLIGVLTIVAVVVSIAARQGSHFTVERHVDIGAAPEKIFPLLADLHQWRQWSPWENIDPQLQRVYSGAASGQGAVYDWRGAHRAGVAHVAITAVSANNIALTMAFAKPVASTSAASFTLAPAGTNTRVTWRLHGPLTLRTRLVTAFIGMDLLLGSDLEKGLAALKTAAEK